MCSVRCVTFTSTLLLYTTVFNLITNVTNFNIPPTLSVFPQDFTVFGGSLSGAHAQKICKVTATTGGGGICFREQLPVKYQSVHEQHLNVLRSDYGPGHDGRSPRHRVERFRRSSHPGGSGVSGWICRYIPGVVTRFVSHYSLTQITQ